VPLRPRVASLRVGDHSSAEHYIVDVAVRVGEMTSVSVSSVPAPDACEAEAAIHSWQLVHARQTRAAHTD